MAFFGRRRSMSRLESRSKWEDKPTSKFNRPEDSDKSTAYPLPDAVDAKEVPFSYHPLHATGPELRLVKILPGAFADPLRVHIIHAPFVVPPSAKIRRWTLEDVQDTVPEHVKVHQSIDGRFIFENQWIGHTSWLHPDPSYDVALYYPAALGDPYGGYEPKYEALSYTWELEPATEKIIVEMTLVASADHMERPGTICQATQSTILMVRPNLMSALRHLRFSDKIRTVWIDAICIDQNSNSERDSEVKKMGDIYRLAHRVVVWLGPIYDHKSTTRALELLRQAGAQIEITIGRAIVPSPSARQPSGSRVIQRVHYDDEDGHVIKEFLDRKWFDRLWIWQEVHMANHRTRVHCGDQSISWSLLRRALIRLWNRRGDLPSSLSTDLIRRRSELVRDIEEAEFTAILWRTSNADFSVDHDRIYSLLGLAPRELSAHIKVDYKSPVATLFRDVCLLNLRHYEVLAFLDFCNPAEPSLPDKPSWVPNWLHPPAQGQAFTSFSSAGAGSYQTSMDEHNILDTYGVLQYAVKEVTAPFEQGILPLINRFRHKIAKGETYYTGDSFLTALHSTLCAGLTREKWRGRNYPSEADLIKFYDLEVPEEDIRDSETPHFKNLAAFEIFLSRGLKGYSLFETRESIGLCLPAAQPGDILAVLLGFEAPVVLRPLGDDKYVFIGRAYSHGLMDGEALLGPLPPGWTVTYDIPRSGGAMQRFRFGRSGVITSEDPRLPKLPRGYRLLNPVAGWFEDSQTGYEVRDPRLSPEVLREEGVHVQLIRLV